MSPIHCWYQVYVSHLQRRAESTTNTQHTKPAKLRHYLPGTSQQFVPVGTAVHNQQDRRRASDGGRAMYVHSKYSSSTCSGLYSCFRTTWCISILVVLCTTNTSGGGRAKVGERRRASDMYVHSNTAVPAVVSTFFAVCKIYISRLAPVRNSFLLFTTRTNFQRRRASDAGQATTYEYESNTGNVA